MKIGDDDPTPVQPPMRPENAALLAALAELIGGLHEHTRRIRELAREVRLSLVPVVAAVVADELERYHREALAQVILLGRVA